MLPVIEVSYIVVTYNSENHVAKCIESILHQSHRSFEIILVDNNSKDDTRSILQELHNKNNTIKIILNSENIGYGNAIMNGFKNSQGEFLAILNADSFLEKEWGANTLRLFRSDDDIMSASGVVFFPDGQVQTTGGMMDKYGAIAQRDGKIYNSRKIKGYKSFYNDGSCFMLRRKILEIIRFDPNLFLYYEDVDMSWRIRLLGYKIGFAKDAISYHDSGQSFLDINTTKFYFLARNRLYVCMKNYSRRKGRWRIPVLVTLLFLNAFVYELSKKQKGYLKGFFKAIFWNLFHLGLVSEEQKKLRSASVLDDEDLDSYLVQKSIELALLK